jgi:hypothetical protein
VLTIATLAAQPGDVSESQHASRLKTAMEQLNKAAADPRMPEDLRRPAQ